MAEIAVFGAGSCGLLLVAHCADVRRRNGSAAKSQRRRALTKEPVDCVNDTARHHRLPIGDRLPAQHLLRHPAVVACTL
jgi:hypothetical protein